jgi:hypothetical protein
MSARSAIDGAYCVTPVFSRVLRERGGRTADCHVAVLLAMTTREGDYTLDHRCPTKADVFRSVCFIARKNRRAFSPETLRRFFGSPKMPGALGRSSSLCGFGPTLFPHFQWRAFTALVRRWPSSSGSATGKRGGLFTCKMMSILIRQSASKDQARHLTHPGWASHSVVYFRLLRKGCRPEFARVRACSSTALVFVQRCSFIVFRSFIIGDSNSNCFAYYCSRSPIWL